MKPQYISLLTLRHRLQGHVDDIAERPGQELVECGFMTKNPVGRSFGHRRLLTPEGERALEGYRLYLMTADSGPLKDADLPAYVRSRLPYATGLGVADAWVERLESVAPISTGVISQGFWRNPLLFGAVSGAEGSYSLERLLALQVAQSYGARFPGQGR